MAANPPKPPGHFLKPLQNQNQLRTSENHNSTDNGSIIENNSLICSPEALCDKTKATITENGLFLAETGNNYCSNLYTATEKTTKIPTIHSDIEWGIGSNQANISSAKVSTLPPSPSAETQSDSGRSLNKESNCNCSNISIMHLFHEMKQEFPTIPDTIVGQCVNENCHQRENCIQMLRNELELNPIPAQSYPAKVLHPRNNSNNINNNNNNSNNNTTATKPSALQKPPLQQKPLIVQQKPPLKPLKPTRAAPLHPPIQQQQAQQANDKTNGNENKINSTNVKNIITNNNDYKPLQSGEYKQSILNATATTNTVNTNVCELNNANGNHRIADDAGFGGAVSNGAESVEKNLPRQRPTTLNLNTQQLQQQRQRLNIQLQQRFQELHYKQQQQQRHLIQNTNTYPIKPLRKAPQPPIAPKPAQFQINHNTNSILNNFHQHTTTSTASPLSESDISVSVSLSTPSPTPSSPSSYNYNAIHHKHNTSTPSTNQQHLQTKSPIRHRSVITLQPEPPYTRGFLYSPASSSSTPATSPSLQAASNVIQTTSVNSSPTVSATGSQKSYTSVNLTLRPPVSPTGNNSVLQPSTIDITAGPGFSGASGGGKSLHYCSTSYDARFGYQQNFQITVNDEGGVFSACRIRPQQIKQRSLNQQFHNNNVVALQQNIQNSIKSPHGIGGVNTTTYSGNGMSGGDCGFSIGAKDYNKSENMCLLPQQAVDDDDLTIETLQRQKKRRDRFAEALRARKKTLSQVKQDINLLTGLIPTEGLSERLDEEIRKLRRDCEAMLRNSSNFTQPPSQQVLSINHHQAQQHQKQQQHYQQPQPFPRQRLTRPPPRPPPPRQTSLDIIQHHSPSSSSTPLTPPASTSPNLNFYNTNTSPQHHQQWYQQQSQQSQQSYSSLPSAYYHQPQSAPYGTIGQNDLLYNTDHDGRDDTELENVEDDDDYEYEEEVLEPWECNMCTFRNHPQLNICEACENVRILPGTLPNLSRALSTTNAAAAVASDCSVGLPTNNALNNSNNSSSSSISRSASGGGFNVANANLEHDTNLVQQQLQHFALHT